MNFSAIVFCSNFSIIASAREDIDALSNCSPSSEASESWITSFSSKQRYYYVTQSSSSLTINSTNNYKQRMLLYQISSLHCYFTAFGLILITGLKWIQEKFNTRKKNDTSIMIPLSDSELLGAHFPILRQKSPSWYWNPWRKRVYKYLKPLKLYARLWKQRG